MKNMYYNGWTLLMILSFINILLILAMAYLFISDALYYQTFGEQMAITSINEMLEFSKKWEWLGLVILPFIIVSRIFLTSMLIYINLYFCELEIRFGELFKMTIIADFVFALSGLAKLVILIFFKEVETFQDLQFTPLSVIEFLDYDSVDPLFIYPISLLNVFELMYFMVLAWLLVGVINETTEERRVNFGKSLKLVTASYGSGLLLWVLLVMFITLNIN